MDLDPAHLLEGARSPVQVADDASKGFRHAPRDQAQLLGVQDLETLEQLLVLHYQVEQHDDLGERHLRIHDHLKEPSVYFPDDKQPPGGRRGNGLLFSLSRPA